jgi:hypothetical protein
MHQGRARRRTIYVALAAWLVAGGSPRAAGAQEAPGPASPTPAPEERVIQLRDGALYRGVILEWVPGSRVTLRLATGELRRFRWVDLAPETLPPPSPSPDAAAAPSPWGPEDGAAEKTRVTLRTKSRYVTLRRQGGPKYVPGYGWVSSFNPWRIICLPPCNRDLPRAGVFRIGGSNDVIIPSAPFELPPGSATLDVKAGTWSGLTGGVLLTTFGGTAAIIGAGLFGGIVAGADNVPSGQRASVGIGGLVTLGVGVGLLTGGIVLLARSHTSVRILDAQGNRVALSLPSRRPLALSAAGLHF